MHILVGTLHFLTSKFLLKIDVVACIFFVSGKILDELSSECLLNLREVSIFYRYLSTFFWNPLKCL